MCFANSIWDSEHVVSDIQVHHSIIEKADRILKMHELQMLKLEKTPAAHLNRH